MGRWSNQDSVGNGYLSLGMSGGTPDHLFWSYATVRIVGGARTCSGTFIGPNVLLTAAHCGHFGFDPDPTVNNLPRPFNAFLYSEGSENANQAVLTSQCETLVQGIGLGDTHLVYCEDVSGFNRSIPPGHLLGMADFDLDPLVVAEPVWSSWWNPSCPGWDDNMNYDPDRCPGPNQMIFSPGQVTKIEAGGVYGADGVVTDQLLNGGASGGAIWRQTAGSQHRLVSSGFTNGPARPGEEAAAGFKAATLTSALQVAMPDPTFGVNAALLQRADVGLAGPPTPWSVASYSGQMDSDQNGFFDVQERLDDVHGIYTGSDTTWLGFESPRRNRMWITNPRANVTFYDEEQLAHIDYSDQGDEIIMEMPKVLLEPGQTYRVSLMSYTDLSSEPEGLSIELWEQGGSSPVSTLAVPTPSTSSWTMFAGELQTTSAIHAVKIRVKSTEYFGSIACLPLIRQNTTNRFDTHGERLNWRNNTTGARAWILPYGGSTLANEVDWAGLVNDQTSAAEDWSLRNRQLAIDPTQSYRVTFKVRSFPQGAGPGVGLVVLGSGAAGDGPTGEPGTDQFYVDESFEFTDSWTTVTSTTFQAAAGDNLLKFGHLQGEPEYLVDDVRILQQ